VLLRLTSPRGKTPLVGQAVLLRLTSPRGKTPLVGQAVTGSGARFRLKCSDPSSTLSIRRTL
jgi:hypothetical protein